MGPNRGGGRRTGGGGHQAGQNAMSADKQKKEKEKAAKRGSRADAAARAKKPAFLAAQQKGKSGKDGRRGGQGGDGTRADEQVVMSASAQAMVTATLRRLDIRSSGNARAGSSSSLTASSEIRHDVDRDDVMRKAAMAVAKKGFGTSAVERALEATK